MGIEENVIIEGKTYAIKSIINSFIENYCNTGTTSKYSIGKIRKGNEESILKVCYENVSPYRQGYQRVRGLSLNINRRNPFIVTYDGLSKDNALILDSPDNISIMDLVPDCDDLRFPNVNLESTYSFACEMAVWEIWDPYKFIGMATVANVTNRTVVKELPIRIQPEVLAQAACEFVASGDKHMSGFYMPLSRHIGNGKRSGKDTSWFVYKTLLIRYLIKSIYS